MRTFLEGVSVVVQPCTLVIALPTLALVLAAGRRGATVAAASVIATSMMMWARAAGHWRFESTGAAIIVIGVLIVIGFAVVAHHGSERVALGGAIGCGAVAGWLWQPCVGEALADILNGAQSGGLGSVLRMVVYTAGALLPAVILAAIPYAWPAAQRLFFEPGPQRVGLVLGAIYAAAVLSGQYDNLIGELSRWSSA